MSLEHLHRDSAIPISDQSLTIDGFCAAENISRSMLYKLWAQGRGPRWYCIGATRRISPEARVEWRREREREAAGANSSQPGRP